MTKDALKQQLDDLLNNPSEDALQHFLKNVKREVHSLPLCPKCGSGNVVRKGFNRRKNGAIQQFCCNSCNHIYSQESIKSAKKRDKYPVCKKCGSKVKRSGFWRWKTSDGKRKSKQRYECLNEECSAFFSLDTE